MAKGKLTEEERDILRKNKYVSDVEEDRIIYTNEFKFLFIEEYMSGKKPTQIFREAGFDPKILGRKRIERASCRWKESYAAGGLGVYQNGSFRRKRENEIKKLASDFEYEKYITILHEQQAEIENLRDENRKLREMLLSR